MAPNILMLNQVDQKTRNYTIQVIVLEKAMPKSMSGSSSHYQRLLFQDIQGNRMQGIIYSPHIDILAKTLKIHHTYAITNAMITKTKEQFRFIPNIYQLVPNGKTPIEEIKVDGLSARALKYCFTPFSALNNVSQPDASIDVLFAVLNVGPRKQVRDSFVCDVRAIDQSMVPITISLWDQFSLYEAASFTALSGSFPTAIGTRLKLSTYQGIGLATRGISGFIFSPTIPEATELQAWCQAHSTEIKDLAPSVHADFSRRNEVPPNATEITKIINMPTAVTQDEYYNIKGTAQVCDFQQRFLYLICSVCKKPTSASEMADFWCNHCNAKVASDARIKIKMQVTDTTGSIDVTIFGDKAESFFNITSDEFRTNMMAGNLALPLTEALAETRPCILRIRAHMYVSSSTSACTFNVVAAYPASPEEATDDNSQHEADTTMMPAITPQKRPIDDADSATSESNAETDTDISQPTKTKQKLD